MSVEDFFDHTKSICFGTRRTIISINSKGEYEVAAYSTANDPLIGLYKSYFQIVNKQKAEEIIAGERREDLGILSDPFL